ncbi:MAG: GerW family sporulation protein [Oscillospiraceae bacterium]|nr:GerW family sporulation protein [Oscillospiraceae bacterium]
MAEKHPIEEIMGVSMDKIREMVDINTIIGEPISSPDGTVIIPVSKVSFGFVSGGSDLPTQTVGKFAGGAGAGVTVKPQSFIVIKKDGDVKLLEMGEKSSPIESVVDALPDIVEKIKSMLPEKDKDKIKDKKEK